jgi:hypothetical protein
MAASSLQAEEKAKTILQNQKEKYQIEFEKLEKENNDLKVSIEIIKKSPINIFFLDQRSNIKTISISLYRIRKSY